MQFVEGRSPRGSFGADFEALIAAARAGRPEAWERLYRALAPPVTGYLRMQGAAEPDDLTSEVFLGLFRGIATFTGDAAGFRSWVFVMAHRRLQDERRRRARRPRLAARDVETGPTRVAPARSAEDDALRALATDRVYSVCAQLVPDQRDVVLLRILGDLTVEQVAAVVGKSAGAVKQLQRRGLEAIRRLSNGGARTAEAQAGRTDRRREGVPL